MYETLFCEGCHTNWSRPIVRGRKPRLCNFCKNYNIKLRPLTPKKPITTLVIDDGGKSGVGYTWERSDCTVRALAIGCGVSYLRAYEFMSKNGRKKNRGAYFGGVINKNMSTSGKVLGKELVYKRLVRVKGIRSALVRNPDLRTGTWIVHSTRHVAVIKDGVLYDSFDSSRKVIDGAWRVT